MEMLSSQTSRFGLAPAVRPSVCPAKKTVFLVHRAPRPTSPIRAALEAKGYEVIVAESVDAALRKWVILTQPVHLFLADIMLGKDPSAEQLVKLLQAENPRMRVLYANDLDATAPLAPLGYPQQLITVIENCLG